MKINSNWNKACALANALCSSSLGKVLLVELSKGQKMKITREWACVFIRQKCNKTVTLRPATFQSENILGVVNCIKSPALMGQMKALWDCKRMGFILWLDGFSNLTWDYVSLATPCLQQAKRVKPTESDWWGRKEEKVSQCPSSKEGSWCWRHHCPAHMQGWHQNRLEPWLPSEANRRRAKWEWWRSEGPNRDPLI